MTYVCRIEGRTEFGCMLLLPNEHPITTIVGFNEESEEERKLHPEEPERTYVLLFYREIGPEEQAALSELDELDANFFTGQT